MYLNNNPSFKQVPVNALNKQLDFSSPIIFICFSGSTDTGVELRILNEFELQVAKPNQIAVQVLLKTGVELKFCDQNDQKCTGHSSRQHYKAAIGQTAFRR